MAAAAADAAERSLHATVEDYDSNDSDHDSVVTNFRRPSPSTPGQANVAAKRSHTSDLGAGKMPAVDIADKVGSIDQQSDSGYSSHTATTMSSADSVPSASSHSPPMAVVDEVPLPPTQQSSTSSASSARRRPTLADERKSSSQNSPRKPLARAPSSSSPTSKPPRNRRPTVSDCTDPDCTQCAPNTAARDRRPDPLPFDSGLDVSYAAPDQRSQRSDPAPSSYTTTPRSPTYRRQPGPYLHGSAVLQPAQSTRRRASSTARSARPSSYHGDPGQQYYNNMAAVPAPYPSPPQQQQQQQQDHGPPLSMSAHYAMQQHPHMHQYAPIMGGTPPNYNGFYPQHHMQISPPYERPSLPTRTQSNNNYNARRPMSIHGQPLVTQPDPNRPSARYAPPSQSAKQENFSTRFDHDSSSSEYDSAKEEQAEETPRPARALMPPPKMKPSASPRRPSLHRRPNTTQVIQTERDGRRMSISQSQMLPERPKERDPRSSRPNTTSSSRAQSTTRPPLVQRKAQSSYDTRDARVIVENSKSRRRQSLMYEKEDPADNRRRSQYDVDSRRQSSVYQEDRYEEEDRRRPKASREVAYEEDERRRRPKTNRVEVYKEEEKRRPKVSREEANDEDERRRRPKTNHVEVYEEEDRRRPKLSRAEICEDGRRRSKVYRDEAYEEDAIVPHRRRKTVTEAEPRREVPRQAKLQNAVHDVEAYQQYTRGNNVPFNDQVHKAAKQSSRVPSGPSDAGSSRSKGSDSKTRVTNRTTMTNGANGEIRLKVDASAPVSLQLNGDMEGACIQMNPAGDGMNELIISNARGGESTYRSERGSVMGGNRRSLMAPPADRARREAEVASVRSRGSQSRREPEHNKVLRRRRDRDYDSESDED